MFPALLLLLVAVCQAAVVGAFQNPTLRTERVCAHPCLSTERRKYDDPYDYLKTAFENLQKQSAEDTSEEWRTQLPTPLQQYKNRCFKRLKAYLGENNNLVNIYVIGTAHVCADSPKNVRLLLETIRPDLIFLELCYSRYLAYTEKYKYNKTEVQEEDRTDPLYDYYLTGEILADLMDAQIGGEFTAANDYWKEKPKEERPLLVLGDRPIQITSVRYQEALTGWERLKMRGAPAVVAILTFAGMIWGVRCALRLIKVGVWVRNVGLRVPQGIIGLVTTMSLLLAGLIFMPFGDSQKNSLNERLEDTSARQDNTSFISSFLLKGGLVLDILANRLPERLKGIAARRAKQSIRSSLFKEGGEKKKSKKIGSNSPTHDKIIIKERDIYMACKLFQAIRFLPARQEDRDDDESVRKKIYNAVVVVGAAHVEGMCNFFSNLLILQNPEAHLPLLLESETTQLSEHDKMYFIQGSVIV